MKFFYSKKYLISFSFFFLFIAFFISNVGLVGNSDTQLGVNIKNIFSSGLSVWRVDNSGSELIFPSLIPMAFQSLFNLLKLSFSFGEVIFLVFPATIYITYKTACLVLDIKGDRKNFLIVLIISIFSITNDVVSMSIVYNSTLIWFFFFFILSIYFFFRYHLRGNPVFLVLMITAVGIMFMDFHTALLAMAFFLSYIIIEFLYDWLMERKINKRLIAEFIVISILFLLMNSYWLIPNVNDVLFNKNAYYKYYLNSQKNTDMVRDAVSNLVSPSFNFIVSTDKEIKDISKNIFLSANLFSLFFLVIFLAASFMFIKKEKNGVTRKNMTIIAVQYILFFSLALGAKNPLGIFDFFWKYVPIFRIFRDFTKFNRIIIPLFVILVSYSIIKIANSKKTHRKLLIATTLAAILVGFFPYYSNFRQFKPYKIPDYYFDYYEFTKSNKLDDKIQVLPVISWYQKYIWSNQDYDMQEPLGYFSGKSMFMNSATYEENPEEKTNKNTSNYLIKGDQKNIFGLTSLRNMKYFLLRDDLRNDYLKNIKIDPKDLENSISSNENLKLLKSFGKLNLYSIDNKYFLPHFYIPQNVIISKRTTDELPRIFSEEGYNINSAIFFLNQNPDKEGVINQFSSDNKNPVLETKKINLTKYRVRVHKANEEFPLIFSESFNDGWKIYTSGNIRSKIKGDLNSYKILNNNEEDQATRDELVSYIKSGYITTLGDGKEKKIVHKKWENMKEKTDYVEKYKIDFISKNFQGTIQNDNLPNGSIFETWWKKPIDDNKNHLMANGYANSWIINPSEICSKNSNCIKNSDGTYDFEIIVEFWPQRLFYIGLFISSVTFLASIGYLIYNYKKGGIRSVTYRPTGKSTS